jgi:hypothetical protein
MTDPLEKVIRPIVEGQIRGFLKEHPSIVEAVDWYKPRQDKSVTFTNSLSKRIVRDLLCPMVRARLAAALVELAAESSDFDRGIVSAGEAARLEVNLSGPHDL